MASDDILVARARQLARIPAKLSISSRTRALVATIGPQRYGFALDRVLSVRLLGRWAPVPHAPAAVVGVAKLDGNVVAVFGGRSWRGLPEELTAEAPVVLLAGRDSPLALLVDSVVDAVDVPDDLPDLRRPGEPWLRGIIDDVLLVDVDRLIDHLSEPR